MNDQTAPPADDRVEPEENAEPATDAAPGYTRFDCTDATDRAGIAAAATAARRAIESGDCIVLPTDTVYGIGADAYDADAVQRLLDAKGRGRDMPPPVLIADAGSLKALTAKVPEQVDDLVAEYWPGPLTIICEAAENLRMDLGETRGTVALRVPDHPLTRELLRKTGPMAVSSANRTGQQAALSCDQAVEQLGDRVAVYLDGGDVSGTEGKPSTMIDFTIKETGQIIRRGALDLEALQKHLPELEDLTATEDEPVAADPSYTIEELRARHTLQPPLPAG